MGTCRQCGGNGGHVPPCPYAYDRPRYPVATGVQMHDHAERWQHADRVVNHRAAVRRIRRPGRAPGMPTPNQLRGPTAVITRQANQLTAGDIIVAPDGSRHTVTRID